LLAFSVADEDPSKQLRLTMVGTLPGRMVTSECQLPQEISRFSEKVQDSLDLWISYVRLIVAQG
jgi:hypothetical protein